jgi:hypothetical protein
MDPMENRVPVISVAMWQVLGKVPTQWQGNQIGRIFIIWVIY